MIKRKSDTTKATWLGDPRRVSKCYSVIGKFAPLFCKQGCFGRIDGECVFNAQNEVIICKDALKGLIRLVDCNCYEGDFTEVF